VSEYWSVKVWLAPDCPFGITETIDGTALFDVVNDQTAELFVPEEFFATTLQ
jgi:hypothetical protein